METERPRKKKRWKKEVVKEAEKGNKERHMKGEGERGKDVV
jgi:hypothetical protein